MDKRIERPIVLKVATDEPAVRSVDPFLLAALIAVVIHLACFFVIDWLTLFPHFGAIRSAAFAILGGMPIRLFQAPLAAAVGIAVYGTWRILRFFGRKFRRGRHFA